MLIEKIINNSMIADPLGMFDCCDVSDGAIAAIMTTPEIAHALGNRDMEIKAVQLATCSGVESGTDPWDGSHVRTTHVAAKRAFEVAGIKNPREELSLMEVHDCFSITELAMMEHLLVSADGRATYDILDEFFDREGQGVPHQVDGGNKCFGHPIRETDLRMASEIYTQLLGQADKRQFDTPSIGLLHNLSGMPYLGVAAVAILGLPT